MTSISRLLATRESRSCNLARDCSPEVDGGVSYSRAYAPDDFRNTKIIDVIRCYELEADGFVVLDIAYALVTGALMSQIRTDAKSLASHTDSLQRIPAWILVLVMRPSSWAR